MSLAAYEDSFNPWGMDPGCKGRPQQSEIVFSALDIRETIDVKAFEIVTYKLDPKERSLEKTSLIEMIG